MKRNLLLLGLSLFVRATFARHARVQGCAEPPAGLVSSRREGSLTRW